MMWLVAAAAAAQLARFDAAGGRAVLVEHVLAAETVRIEVAFPAGYARAEWPTLGILYWHQLRDCVTDADRVPLRTTVEADAVRLSGVALTDDLPELLVALRAAMANPVACDGVDVGDAVDARAERVEATPAGRLRALAARALFAEGDPRRDPFGDTLSRYADAIELESFRDRVVGLRGAVVSVVGACDAACALRATTALFPDAPWGAPPALAPLPPTREGTGAPITGTLEDLPQLHVGIARLAPGAASADWPAFLLVDLALSRRLHARLRERDGRVYGVSNAFVASSCPDLWLQTTMVRPAGADVVITGMHDIIADLGARGLTEAELGHLRAVLRGRLTPDDPILRARLEGDVLLAGGTRLAGRQALEAAIAAPLDVVNAFAARFLAADAFVELRLAPEDSSGR
jgi:predicted Zn-dependent peptidase